MESGYKNQPQAKLKLPAVIAIGCSSLFLFCCCCGFINYLFNPPTPTPVALTDPVETIIASTSAATPFIETLPTATIHLFEVMTSAAQPTQYIYSTNTPFALPTKQLQPTSPSTANCDPSYPDVCINGNPRLNCEQLRAKGIFHFRVLPPDPLGYDRDNDGIGCE